MEHVDILREEYLALRAEICQSITYQHQILLGGYGLAATVVGAIAASVPLDNRALIVIPIVLLGMSSLWAVECNRMVRASYYIADVLWPRLCKLTNCPGESGWETWIRAEDYEAGRFRRRQDILQQAVTITIPILFSIGATVGAATGHEPIPWIVATLILGLVVQVPFWILVRTQIRAISDLRASMPHHSDRTVALQEGVVPLAGSLGEERNRKTNRLGRPSVAGRKGSP
jgi:hypothetical protein